MSTDLASRGPGRPKKASRKLVTIEKAADYLQITPRSIRRYIADGKLPGYRVGTTMIRVDLYEVDALVRRIPAAQAGEGR